MEEMHSQKQVIVREEAKEEEDAQNVNNIYSSITQLSNMFYGLWIFRSYCRDELLCSSKFHFL